ncbi:hypothetical protein CROQUDRAFT_657201 [Cronartium quercuum f. sp. fusiforme G11]|uniref:General negative regulator of transcription subunit 1 n=1 Tax=Cronartium quercuum f. sp. fusiforme G11 TaxID=708437 RepID=A0A9P6NJ52_9BASI|nr:hypothetical protein CROQUDRAFT_657201 [Cronartium quercuum f. sp. fusiforme G11]
MLPTTTPPPGLSVLSAQQQRANELAKIAKTQIVFKIGGLTEENFAYAQQEIQAVVRQNPGDTDLFYIQRLIHASISALGFQSSHNLSSGLILNSNSQSQLALRLLTSELKLLARDPFAASKFASALAAALHAGDAFELPAFVRATGLHPLERLLLLPPLLGLLALTPPPPPPSAPLPPGLPPPPATTQHQHPALLAKKRQIARDAAQILRESIGAALHSLSIPISPAQPNPNNNNPSTPSPSTGSEEQMPELTAIQLSKLLAIVISDTALPTPPPDEPQPEQPEWLWTPTVQRAAVQALVSRVGQELAAQIANHCLTEARFPSAPTPIALLYRICSDPTICTADLCKSVLLKTGRGTGSSGSAETEVSEQLRELVVLASKYGPEFHIDHVSWIRAVGEHYSNRIRWSNVIILAFDRPQSAGALPEGWGLRFLAKVLSLAPSLTPAAAASSSDQNSQDIKTPTSASSSSSVASARSTPAVDLSPARFKPTAAISSLFETWRSPLSKIQLIDRLLSLPLDASPFLHALKSTPLAPMVGPACHRLVATEELGTAASATIRLLAKSVEMSAWNVKELVCELGKLLGQGPGEGLEAGEAEKVVERASELVERACKANPELVMIALVQVERPWGVLHNELANQLLQSFLTGHPSHQLVFQRLWQLEPTYLIGALQEFYDSSEMNVTRVLDIAQDLKILDSLLTHPSASEALVLDLASLASRREYLNLDKWLSDRLSGSEGARFAHGCLDFLAKKVAHDLARHSTPTEPTTLALSAPTVSIFIRTLRAHHELLSLPELERFKEIRTQAVQLHPKLMNFLPGNTDEPGVSLSSFDARTEAEVDAFYKKMYDLELSVDQIVSILRAMLDSNEPHSHQFLACLLSGLFDEYKFFATYPAKELSLTAALFGSLVREQLIGYVPLGIAVRYVLDAIRHPIESKWYAFGSQALARFAGRLEEWPQLAGAVAEVEGLRLTHPEVYHRARAVLGGEPDSFLATVVGKGVESGGETSSETSDQEERVFSAISSDDELIKREIRRRKAIGLVIDPTDKRLISSKAAFVEPPEEVSDKILFVINNLSPNNLESKLLELTRALTPELHVWFAKYLVTQRVSIEPNNHTLYLNLIEQLEGSDSLVRRVINETLIKCSRMLECESTLRSGAERTILKNLGGWLGSLTLARDRPIKHRQISFKELLTQGLRSKKLIVAIPFVCKVLEQANKSKIFKPPNPWLMAILQLLIELYKEAELKLNLKFEIEVLCKALSVELSEFKVNESNNNNTLIKSFIEESLNSKQVEAVKEVIEIEELNLERNSTANAPIINSANAPLQVNPVSVQNNVGGVQGLGSGGAGYASGLQELLKQALVELPHLIKFGRESSDQVWRRIVLSAIERAIKDIIGPVVERSVTIASISTRELMVKDFAMEGSEDRMRVAARLMVRHLAAALAAVTTREPLRNQIVANVRSLVLNTEGGVGEEEILWVANENLEVACQVVEKVATEKAMMEIDDCLSAAYEARRRHRELTTNAFWDTSAMAASHYSGMLPSPLRLKLGGLEPDQLRIYEEFSVAQPPPTQSHGEQGEQQPQPQHQHQQQQQPRGNRVELVHEVLARINALAAEVEAEGREEANVKGQVEGLIEAVAGLESTMGVAQKCVAMLYRTGTSFGRDVWVGVLEAVCRLSPKVGQEVCQWLLYAEDERKYSVPVTLALVGRGIVPVTEFDGQMARLIVRDYKPSVVGFVAEFLVGVLDGEASENVSVGMMRHSIGALGRAVQLGRASPGVRSLLERVEEKLVEKEVESEETNAKGLTTVTIGGNGTESGELRDQLSFCFAEWVRMYANAYSIEKPFIDFVSSLQAHGILKGEELSSAFFRVCMELSIDAYIKAKAAGRSAAGGIFQPVDAFARLIALMVKYHTDPTGVDVGRAKTHYMSKLLSIVLLVMGRFQKELGVHFQQKPFFRFFSSLLVHLHALEGHLGSSYQSLMMTISNLIDSMQPANFPGFATSWMALISHRLLMPKLLMFKDREGWPAVHRLLLAHLGFLRPFLNAPKLGEVGRTLYTGTVRILLVLLHDFPTFLAVYYHSLVSAIPVHCIQLSNVILAAYPAGVGLVDPFGQGFRLEKLPESRVCPTIMSDYITLLETEGLRARVESVLGGGGERGELVESVVRRMTKDRSHSNTATINSLVLFLGVRAIGNGENDYEANSESAMILKDLIEIADPECRYMILVSCIYQLRWPNAHTKWYSNLLIDIYTLNKLELIKDQLIRVFLERVIVQRPHPFGIIYSFIHLLFNLGIDLDSNKLNKINNEESYKELKALLGICRRHV